MSSQFKCQTCGKKYNKKYNLDRHVEKVHPEEDSDNDSDEEEGPMSKEDEVEVIGLLVKTLIGNMEEEEEEEKKKEDEQMESIADILKPENYSKLRECFKDKVLEFILL